MARPGAPIPRESPVNDQEGLLQRAYAAYNGQDGNSLLAHRKLLAVCPAPSPGCGRSMPATVPCQFLADRQLRPFLGNEEPPCGVERNCGSAQQCVDDEARPHRRDVDAEPSGDGRCHPAEHAAVGWATQQSRLQRVGAFGGRVCRLSS